MVDLPGKPEDSGFLIADEFYAFPSSMRVVDPILVDELTGYSWGEFAQLLDEQPDELDVRTLVGLVGIAVWQKNPKWARKKVVEFVSQLDFDALNFTAPEVEDDAVPPALEDDATSTSGDRSESTEESSATSPDSTGLLPSEITAA
jgi:hypothetical protein